MEFSVMFIPNCLLHKPMVKIYISHQKCHIFINYDLERK